MPVFRLVSRRFRLAALPLLVLEAALVVAWSSGFVGARYAVDHAPVFLVVFWRCVLVCLLLLPWAWKELRAAPARAWARHASIGLLAMAGYLAGVVEGIEQGVPTALAALIADLLPLGTALLAGIVLRQPAGWRVWTGLLVGLGGVLLVTRGALAAGAAPWWAYALPVLGMLSLAVATLWQAGGTARGPDLSLAANLWLQCAVSGLVFAALASLEGGLIPPFTAGVAVSVAWTAVLSSLGGYGLYWICLRRTSPTRVASVLYLSPGVTAVWAWAMFAEPLSWQMALGMGVSVAGIMLVARGERRPCAAQVRTHARMAARGCG